MAPEQEKIKIIGIFNANTHTHTHKLQKAQNPKKEIANLRHGDEYGMIKELTSYSIGFIFKQYRRR